jgi:hypothetical protein
LILAIPGLRQHKSPTGYYFDEVCHVCRKERPDNFGEHVLHCREFPGFKYRHDFVPDVLFYIFRRAGISTKKEAFVNFLTDPRE